jgi:DNA-binding MarR family transcriptional regulator
LGRLLSTAARLVERDWNAVLATRQLTHAGLMVLTTLLQGPLTQRELAAASRVEEQTISRVLEKLERAGYVSRQRASADRRRRMVTLSSSGAATLAEMTLTGIAERLVADRVDDPVRFRAELVRLVESSTRIAPLNRADGPGESH